MHVCVCARVCVCVLCARAYVCACVCRPNDLTHHGKTATPDAIIARSNGHPKVRRCVCVCVRAHARVYIERKIFILMVIDIKYTAAQYEALTGRNVHPRAGLLKAGASPVRVELLGDVSLRRRLVEQRHGYAADERPTAEGIEFASHHHEEQGQELA